MDVAAVVEVVEDTSETPNGIVRISRKIFSLFSRERNRDSEIDDDKARGDSFSSKTENVRGSFMHNYYTRVCAHQSSLVCHPPRHSPHNR